MNGLMNRSVAASESRAAAPRVLRWGVGPPTSSRTRPLRPHGRLVGLRVSRLSKEIGRLSLGEALELTLLIARKDPRRHPSGDRHRDAALTLRAMTERGLVEGGLEA